MIGLFKSWTATVQIVVVVAVISAAWGAWELIAYNQRAQGAKAITDKQQAQDFKTLQEKAKRDAEIRDLSDTDLSDRLRQ